MISQNQITELSKRLAIDEFTITKEYLQVVFLGILYSTKESQKIYFKGGTAIRLLMQSERFSEDLDFTAELTTKELDKITNNTVKKMNLTIPGVLIKKTQENKLSYTAILNYQPEDAKYPMTIHLDFSLREKPETIKETVLETDFPVAPQPIIVHLDWTEVLAEKIRAFLYRDKGRDIYDLWFLLSKGVVLDWAMVNRKMKFYNMEASSDIILEKIKKFDDKKLLQDLNKFLPVYDRGLISQLKNMATEQLISRQSFTIATSKNVNYSKLPVQSFNKTDKFFELEDMKTSKIAEIKRQDENSIEIKIISPQGLEGQVYVRAKNRNGVRELDAIIKEVNSFKNLSYTDFINKNIG